jgi:hypothetical protein
MAGEEELPGPIQLQQPQFVNHAACIASVDRNDRIRSQMVQDPPLANASVDIHIDVDSLIRDNREGLRFRSNMPGRASLDIQNIIARQQCSMIVSIPVRSNPRDFFFFIPAQDDQRIVGIVFRCRFRRSVSIGKLNLLGRKDLQMPLHETLRRGVKRCSADQNQKDAARNQMFKATMHCPITIHRLTGKVWAG